jgi:uncharacterized protein DUF397
MKTADSEDSGLPLWRISSRCNGGDCVRVAPWGQGVLLGDTKSPDGPILAYSQLEWDEFVKRIKRGDYDDY